MNQAKSTKKSKKKEIKRKKGGGEVFPPVKFYQFLNESSHGNVDID